MRKFFTTALAVILMFSTIAAPAVHACDDDYEGSSNRHPDRNWEDQFVPEEPDVSVEESIAEKTSTPTDEDGRFKVEIQVPGGDGESQHDEVIIMVDGSYSTDDDWGTTRAAIIEIGKTVLEGSGNTQLTLMTFGMGDNIVIEHIVSVSELDENLTELPGGLLYGRSSTNCEAGFTGIQEYIENHDDTLNEVQVVYITDGEINTDETEYVFYNWEANTWLKQDAVTLAKWSLSEECYCYAEAGTNLSDAYVTVFGDTVYTADEVSTDGVISDEDALAWMNQVWADVYAYNDMDTEAAYAVSDAERAFVDYDNENNTHIQEVFYYTLWGRSYPDRWTRTPEAGLALAECEGVAHVYMVDSNGATSWMSDMANESENVSFEEAGSISNLITALESVLTDLSYTPYNDVVITDYMSKWVNLDETTIAVIDNYAGEVIWTNVDGWLIDENRPTDEETPVIIEEVSEDNYEDGGVNVIGNENGTIYKLTWFVKDGAMLRNHNYSLVYEVEVDVEENGFRYETYYPANGTTTIEYTEKTGEDTVDIEEQIAVPNVIVDEPEDDKTDCDDNHKGDKPDCEDKHKGDKTDCDDNHKGDKTDCDDKHKGDKTDCDDKTEGGKNDWSDNDCGDKTEGGKNNWSDNDCDDKTEGGRNNWSDNDCDDKTEGGRNNWSDNDCGDKTKGGKNNWNDNDCDDKNRGR